MLLKLRSTGVDMHYSGLLWLLLGAAESACYLSNSDFLESRHPPSPNLCVYSDTQSLLNWTQSSWLVMGMRESATCTRAWCEFVQVLKCANSTVCVIFSGSCTPEEAYWWRLAATSVISCVSVSNRRFDWPSMAMCWATSLFLWERQACTKNPCRLRRLKQTAE